MIFAVHLSPIRIGGVVVAQLANMSGSSGCLTGPTVVTIVAGTKGLPATVRGNGRRSPSALRSGAAQ
jgi:hypothetical protein